MMKKWYRVMAAILLLLFAASSAGCQTEEKIDAHIGMKLEEFCDAFSEEEYFKYGDYLFFRNSINEHCVAFVSEETNEISTLESYPEDQIECTDENFARIEAGMSMEQVVSMVGIPEGSCTFGMSTVCYHTETGNDYWIYLCLEETKQGTVYSVASVLLLDSEMTGNE